MRTPSECETILEVESACDRFIQEYRTEHTLEALRSMTAPTAKCRRDGVLRVIDASLLVTGDVIELEAGDRVPADCAVVSASGFFTDESILTGESEPVPKISGAAHIADIFPPTSKCDFNIPRSFSQP